jgi:SAM-dependent methyltransferase
VPSTLSPTYPPIASSSSANQAVYDLLAGEYDLLVRRSPFYSNVRAAELTVLNKRINESGDLRRVLDVGCGSGETLHHFASLGLAAHGIDFSPRMIELARARTIMFDRQVELSCIDCMETQHWPRGPFDLVVSFSSVVNHLPDVERWRSFFCRAAEVLRPRGTFIFTMDNILALDSFGWLFTRFRDQTGRNALRDIWRSLRCIATRSAQENEWPLFYQKRRLGLHLSYLPVPKARQLLTEAGFEVVAMHGVNALSALVPGVVRSSTYAAEPSTKVARALTKIDELTSRQLHRLAANLIFHCELADAR